MSKLIDAIKLQNLEAVKEILDSPHYQDTESNLINKVSENLGEYQSTALHLAIRFGGNEEIVNLLIERGANVNAQNDEGYTPLHLASYMNNEKLIGLLLSCKDIDINLKDVYGNTAESLHSSYHGENPEISNLFKMAKMSHARMDHMSAVAQAVQLRDAGVGEVSGHAASAGGGGTAGPGVTPPHAGGAGRGAGGPGKN